jgi:hypothetical protein
MLYDKKEDFMMLSGLIATMIALLIKTYFHSLIIFDFLLIFFLLFGVSSFLLGGFFIVASGYISKTILPKLLAIIYIGILNKGVINALLNEDADRNFFESFFVFHLFFSLFILILFWQIKFLLNIISIVRKKTIKDYEIKIPTSLRTTALIVAVIWLCFGKWTFYRIEIGLKSPLEIANKLYKESSVEIRVGAYCEDGTESNSIGRGTCSHHGGVDYWKTETVYNKTYKECYQKAKELSWFD